MGKKLIPVDEIQEGMVTADPVVDDSGTILLREGTDLSRNWVLKLQARGVSSVVVMVDGEAEPVTDAETMQAAEQRAREIVRERFRDVLDAPLMQQIAHCALRFHRKRLAREGLTAGGERL